jgi:endonuclease/exonuclease/phosphatase family metal-dependent hydrolase
MKRLFALSIAVALLGASQAQAADSIDVMTQNQYLGADLTPIVTAPDAASFNAAVITALQEIAANDFPARAQQLAELIADRVPELVGLQEVYQFSCVDLPSPGIGGCAAFAGAFNDHLVLTLAALDALEADYDDVAFVENLNFTAPVFLNADLDPDILVTVIDRDVILAHGDVMTTKLDGLFTDGGLCGLPIPNPFPIGPAMLSSMPSFDGCNYTILAPATLPNGSILPIARGFVGVDATVEGKTYRFVNTHLEVMEPDAGNPASAIFQSAQSFELLATLTTIPSNGRGDLIVGDINSSPDDPIGPIVPPYAQFVGVGYTDAWDLRPGNQQGFSCCELADLSNQQSQHDERIDVIFTIEVPSKVKKARVLGSKVSDKIPPPGQGLWPSDHGSVSTDLRF